MSQRFLIVYPDGSRGKVSADQKRSMQTDGVLQAIGGNRFRYVGQEFRCRSLAGLSLYKTVITSTRRLGNYPGLFLFVHRNRRRREILESPEKMVLRLRLGEAVP